MIFEPKRNYSLQIADYTTKTLSNNIPNYTTKKVDFKKWFENDSYRDETFIATQKSNPKVRVTYNSVLFEKQFENVKYREARLQAMNYLIENKALKSNDYLMNDIFLKVEIKGNEIHHKMKWKAVSNGNVEFEGWDYYENNKLSVGNSKKMFKHARRAMWSLTTFFIISFFLSLFLLKNQANWNSNIVNDLKTGLSYLNFIGGLTYSGIVSTIRDEYNKNLQSHKEIIYHNIKLEIPFWLAASTTLIGFVYEELSLFYTILVIVVAIVLLFIKLIFDYDFDDNRYYSDMEEKARRR